MSLNQSAPPGKAPEKSSNRTPTAGQPERASAPQPARSALLARRKLSPDQLTPGEVQWLQRSVGNQSVQRMLAHAAPPGVQPKLEVGPVSDRYEQEADHIARQVVDQPTQPSAVSGVASTVQRSAGGEDSTSDDRLIAHELTHGMQQNGGQKIQRWPWSKKNKKKRKSTLTETVEPSEVPTTTSENSTSGNDENYENRSFLQPHVRPPSVLLDGEMMRGGGLEPETQLINDSVPQTDSESEEAPRKTKSNKAPYNKHFRKFVKGSRKKVNLDDLENSHRSAGSIEFATPDYVNPELANQDADQYTVTVAVGQEHAGWWDMVKKMKATGIRKLFQSPIKFIKKIVGGKGEGYLTEKVLKQQNKLPENEKEREETLKKAIKDFHKVGHTWVRFSKRVGGKIKELYSYGFWPRSILGRGGWDMGKYVPGQIHHPDTFHEADAQKSYHDTNVTAEKFNEALALAQSHYQAPPNYHLLDYNCTKFAREILKKAGGTFPGKGVLPNFAFSPGQLMKQINDLQKDGSSLTPNESVRSQDSEEDRKIIEEVGKGQESRSRATYNEAFGLTPKDPKDYPQGIYDKPIKGFGEIKASEELGDRLDKTVFIPPMAPEHDLEVTDEMTQMYGVGLLEYQDRDSRDEFEKRWVYVDLAAVLEPGSKPSHDSAGNPINYEQPKPQIDTGTLPEHIIKPSALSFMKMREWETLIDPDQAILTPKDLDALNEEQVARLAELIKMTPFALARVIAKLNGKPLPEPPPVPSCDNRPQLSYPEQDAPPLLQSPKPRTLPQLTLGLNLLSGARNQAPLNPVPKVEPPSQEGGDLDAMLAQLNSSVDKTKTHAPQTLPPISNVQSQTPSLDDLLTQLNGNVPPKSSTSSNWGEVDDLLAQLGSGLGPTEGKQQGTTTTTGPQDLRGTHEELLEDHRDEQQKTSDVEEDIDDSEEEIEIPEELEDKNVFLAMKFDEWDDIFDLMNISKSVFKSLTDEQIEAIAPAIGKTPEAFKELIKGF